MAISFNVSNALSIRTRTFVVLGFRLGGF
jgi:hypothetical protein